MVVERDRELDTLRHLLASSAEGRGRVALVVGGLASGKTELLAAFAEEVAVGDALLLTASGARVERNLPMGVMWQLFRSVSLPQELLDRVSELATWDARGEPDARAAYGLCALLLELAKDRPLVLTIDDVQHVDSASLQVLLSLRRRMRSARVLLVLTEWERPSLTRTLQHAELARQPDRRIALAPLTFAGVVELIERRLGAVAAVSLAPAFYGLAGGNPLLTNALIEDRSHIARVAAVGAVFRQDVLDCLNRWDADIMVVARGVAVLDGHATPDLVGRLLELPDRSVSPVFGVLRSAGLMISDRLRNPAIVATVLEGTAHEESSRLHLRAAELLYGRGAGAVEIARHLVTADAVPGPWAIGLLRQASDQSVAGDDRFAVACLELALRVCAKPDHVALRTALVRVAWRVNPSAVAPQVSLLRDALGAGELTWRDVVPVVRHLLWQGDLPGAADQLRSVRAEIGAPDGRTAAELRFVTEWIYGQLPEDVRAVLADPDRPSASPLTRTVNLLSRGADVVSGAEHVLQSCLGDVLPEVGAMAVLALDHADQHERAWFWGDVLADEAERRGATTWSALLGCVRADLAWRRGDLAGAMAHADAALDLLHPRSWGVLVGLPLSTRILAMTAMGHVDAAAELLTVVVPAAMFDTVFGARYLHATGCHNLASGRPLAAVDDFERCGALMKASGLDVPAMVPWRSDLGQAYLAIGMRKRARELAVEQLDLAGSGVDARTRAISLRVLAAAGDPRNLASVLHEAIQLLERCGDQFELARALTDLGHAHREVGELSEARLVLRRAEQELKACRSTVPAPPSGMPAPCGPGQVRAEHAPEPTVNGVAALSEAERNVAALAALGHTNRKIGRMLYITVSTVEQHLTRVYRKLNVSRRTDLPSDLSHRDTTADRALVAG